MPAPFKAAAVALAALLFLLPAHRPAFGQDQAGRRYSVESVQAAAEAGDPEAQYRLALLYYAGLMAPKSKAGEWLLKSAEGGHAPAQTRLGLDFLEGANGRPRNYQSAEQWLRKAAVQDGTPLAKTHLGRMCFDGLASDRPEAGNWLEKALAEEPENPLANHYLGLVILSAEAPPQGNLAAGPDPEDDRDRKALGHFLKAAEGGHNGAALISGLMLQNARGGPKNPAEALRWLNRAAENGDLSAMSYLGAYYLTDADGAGPDYELAGQWLRKAAERGGLEAQAALAVVYIKGWGVKKDLQEAQKWLDRARRTRGKP